MCSKSYSRVKREPGDKIYNVSKRTNTISGLGDGSEGFFQNLIVDKLENEDTQVMEDLKEQKNRFTVKSCKKLSSRENSKKASSQRNLKGSTRSLQRKSSFQSKTTKAINAMQQSRPGKDQKRLFQSIKEYFFFIF